MPNELDETPEISGDGDSQGQADDSAEASASSQPLDLTQTPEWRAAQSAYDRRVADAERALAEERRVRQQEQARLSALQAVVEQLSPEEQEVYELKVLNEAKDAELAHYREMEQLRQFDTFWQQRAQEEGLDFYGPEFQAARQQALAARDNAYLVSYVAFQRGRRATETSSPAKVMEQENNVADKTASQGKGGYTLPPSGQPVRAMSAEDKETLSERLIGLLNEPTKNAAEIAQIRKKLAAS